MLHVNVSKTVSSAIIVMHGIILVVFGFLRLRVIINGSVTIAC